MILEIQFGYPAVEIGISRFQVHRDTAGRMFRPQLFWNIQSYGFISQLKFFIGWKQLWLNTAKTVKQKDKIKHIKRDAEKLGLMKEEP